MPSKITFDINLCPPSMVFPGRSDEKGLLQWQGPWLIPGSGRSPGEGNGYPLHYSCLENSMDREAWWSTVYLVTESEMTEWWTLMPSILASAQRLQFPLEGMDGKSQVISVHFTFGVVTVTHSLTHSLKAGNCAIILRADCIWTAGATAGNENLVCQILSICVLITDCHFWRWRCR